MKIFQKTIATLLTICMMFTVLPQSVYENLSLDVFAADVVGTSGYINSNGIVGKDGGYMGEMPYYVISLMDTPKNYNDLTNRGEEAVVAEYRDEWIKIDDYATQSLYFVPYDGSYTGKDESVHPLNEALAYAHKSTEYPMQYIGVGYYTDGGIYNDLSMSYNNVPIRKDSGQSNNYFYDNVMAAYDNKSITSIADLSNGGWRKFIDNTPIAAIEPNMNTRMNSEGYKYSVAVLGYLLGDDDDVDGRIERFTNPGGFDSSDIKNLTARQKLGLAAGYVGLLANLYNIAEGRGLTGMAGKYEAAINSYCSNSNNQEAPVTLGIEKAYMIQQKNADDTQSVFSLKVFDYMRYYLLTDASYDIIDETFVQLNYPGSAGSTKEMMTSMLKESVKQNPLSKTAATNSGYIRRIADNADKHSGNPKYAGALGWVQNAFQFTYKERHEVQAGNNVVYRGHGGKADGILNTITIKDGTDLYGFMIVGNYVATPPPKVSFSVDSTVQCTQDVCSEDVSPTTPAKIRLTIDGGANTSGLIEILNSRLENNEISIPIEVDIKRTVYRESIGNVHEGREDEDCPALEAGVALELSGQNAINVLSGQTIELQDTEILQDLYTRDRNSATTMIYKYDVDVTITIDGAKYEYKSDDIVLKNGSTPLNFASFQFKAYATPGTRPEPVPQVDVTTEKWPSDVEGDIENWRNGPEHWETTAMVKSYEYTSEGSAFAEIKSNKPLNEKYEVLGGIPSSEELYFSVGGSEFKVAMVLQYWMNQHSRDRTYHIHFEGNTCEFNNQEKGKGDSWEGIDLPKASSSRAKQTETRFEHASTSDPEKSTVYPEGLTNNKKYGPLTVTITWEGKIKNNAKEVSDTKTASGHSSVTIYAECVAEPDHTDYLADVADANAFMTAMAGKDWSWTAASDKVERKLTVTDMNIGTGDSNLDPSGSGSGSKEFSFDLNGNTGLITGSISYEFTNPATTLGNNNTSFSCNCGGHGEDGSGDSPVTQTTVAKPDTEKPYKITLTYTIKPHAICGPCCGHVMPDIWDMWKQGLIFDYAKISQIRLFKLDQGSVDGLEELTGINGRVFANVVSGNPTYFMNIAQQTASNYDKATGTVNMPVKYTDPDTETYKEFGRVNYLPMNKSELTKDNHSQLTYYSSDTRLSQSSRAGRLRYVLAPGENNVTIQITEQGNGTGGSYTLDKERMVATWQHDDVFYELSKIPNASTNGGRRSMNCDGMASTNNFGKLHTNNSNPTDDELTGHENEWADGILYTNILGFSVHNANSPGINKYSANGQGNGSGVTGVFTNYWKTDSFGNSFSPLEMMDNDKRALSREVKANPDGPGAIADTYFEDYDHHGTLHGFDMLAQFNIEKKDGYYCRSDAKDRETAEWKFIDAARKTKVVANVISDFLILQTSGGDQSIFYYEKATEPTELQAHFKKLDITEEEIFDQNPLSVFNTNTEVCVDTDNGALKEANLVDLIAVGGYNGQYNNPTKKYLPYSTVENRYLSFPKDGQFTYDAHNKSGTYNVYGGSTIKTIFDTGAGGGDPARTISRPKRQATSQDTSFKVMQDNIRILPTAPNKLYTPSDARVWYSQVEGFYSTDMGYKNTERDVMHIDTIGNVSIGNPQKNAYGEDYKINWGNEIGVEEGAKYFATPDGNGNSMTVNNIVVYTPVSTEDAMILEQGDLEIGNVSVSRDQRVDNSLPNMNDMVNKLKVCPLDPAECEYRVLNCKYHEPQVLAQFNFEDTYEATEQQLIDGEFKNVTVTKQNTYMNGSTLVTTNILNGIEYQLPTGFSKSNGKLVANGGAGTRWTIPFADIGLSNSANNTIQIDMDLTVNSGSLDKMVVGLHNVGLLITNTNNVKTSLISRSLLDNTKPGVQLDSTFNNVTNVTNAKVSLKLCFNNIEDCEVTINGNEASVEVFSEYKKTWTTEIDENGNEFRTQITEVVELEDLVAEPPSGYKTTDIGTNINIGCWGQDNAYGANFTMDNLKITLLGGSTDHTSACYETVITHSTKKVHVCDENCYTKEDMYLCNGVLNSNYQLGCGKEEGEMEVTGESSRTYSYTGNIQTVTLTKGQYILETWGAQGNAYSSSYGVGGKGGYSKGTLTINDTTTLYIGVGGTNGYNGGGSAGNNNSGGGATHIGLKTGLLTAFSSDYSSKLLMVAGGGGGAQYYTTNTYGATPGVGGGSSGTGGTKNTGSSTSYYAYSGYGGSQSAGGNAGSSYTSGGVGTAGTFGQGGNGYNTTYGGGGGGGFYGGGGGAYTSGGTNFAAAGGGGSGYVNTSKLDNATTTAGNETFNAVASGTTEIGHSGNGAAKITVVVGSNNGKEGFVGGGAGFGGTEYGYSGSYETVVLQPGNYSVELYGAEGGSYSTTLGSKGTYVKGNLTLDTTTTVYLYVGGKGQTGNNTAGGWNGGGQAGGCSCGSGSGGGATDIRIGGTALENRVMVAGGGGGAGTSGNAGRTTAKSNGTLGTGERGHSSNDGGGGGGGYHGGYTGQEIDAGGYIGTSFVNGTEFTSNASTDDYTVTLNSHSGNGKIIITKLGHSHVGKPGMDYPNGCYTVPTEHKHIKTEKVLICDKEYDIEGTYDVYTFGTGGNKLNSATGTTSITLPAGDYLLEAWGAQGNSPGSSYGVGGKGGYSKGTLTLTSSDTLYITVGGTNGYNGGGNQGTTYSGGGATHIALSSVAGGTPAPDICYGTYQASTPYCWIQNSTGCTYEGRYAYSDSATSFSYHCSGWARVPAYDYKVAGMLSNMVNSKSDILLVAGGGGGVQAYNTDAYSSATVAGVGGGSSGTGGTKNTGSSTSYYVYSGYGGSQSAGGAGGTEYNGSYSGSAGTFGQGGSGSSTGPGGGGGGGYYGGGGGAYTTAGTNFASNGGGGSGYVNTSKLSSTSTKVGNTSFLSPEGVSETGHSGNGYVKISAIPKQHPHVHTDECYIITNGRLICGLEVGEDAGTVYTFGTGGNTFTSASGSTAMTLPAGVYDLEVWGAQGGGGYTSTSYTSSGGKGGYSKGTITLLQDTPIYVYVGGQGTTGTSSTNYAGGFNGGGQGYYYAGGGGGASDIRIGSNSLYSRVIVAGGGGGSTRSGSTTVGQGGYGGGASGGSATCCSNWGYTYTQTGGTQTAGGTGSYSNYPGTFGAAYNSYGHYTYTGGGGGGWYGGSSNTRNGYGGGGGSGYVYTTSTVSSYPSGCTLNSSYLLTDAQTYAGNTSFPTTAGTSNEIGHSGNGFVKITSKGHKHTENCYGHNYSCGKVESGTLVGEYSLTSSPIAVSLSTGTYKLEVWGAEGGSGTYTSGYTALGGKGGYSVGYLTLDSANTAYVYVGGKGTSGTSSAYYSGGYNGGGQGYYYSGGGGGATDIRLGGTALSNRIIVAGGGGGGSAYSSYIANGGYGGGTTGGNGYGSGNWTSTYTCTGGTQTAGGTGSYGNYPGTSGTGGSTGYTYAGGGGGGYYGGAGGTNNGYSGAGGSGYVSSTLKDAQTLNGNSLIPTISNYNYNNYYGYNNAVATEVGHSGNGYARIYRIDHHHDNSCTIYGYGGGGYTCGLTTGSEVVVKEFSYTGTIENYTLTPGTYKLETWGAQGGGTTDYPGGKGGYSVGTYTVTQNTTIYVAVGQNNNSNGSGYNGGGRGGTNAVGIAYGYGGGGATHIGLKTGLLTAFSSDYNSKLLMVAGGGGGSDTAGIGGAGGGTSGTTTGGAAGTQTTGYAFGEGEPNQAGGAAGGGGGFYGGKGGYSGTTTNGGGGGSGYVNTNSGFLTNATTTAGNESFKSPTGSNETGHTGNGYARITRLGHTHTSECGGSGYICGKTENTLGTPIEFSYKNSAQPYTLPEGKYKLEVWGAEGGSYSTTYSGGKGGYSVGELTLTESTDIFVYTGEKGSYRSTNTTGYVFNNGGYGTNNAGDGGGGTDIRIGTDSLYARVIVAGGGGGASSYGGPGGYGGGISGGTPTVGQYGYGGTQTAGGDGYNSNSTGVAGSFGYGGTCLTWSGCGAGGGGWYGGGTAGNGPGGGGSGYVYTSSSSKPTNYLLGSEYYLTNASTTAGNTSFLSPTGTSETGHSGNGYARITPLEGHKHSAACMGGGVQDFEYTGEVETVTLGPGTHILETWGAQGGGNTSGGDADGGIGGNGGYSIGTLTLNETTTVYIRVGGVGGTSESGKANGGFNGGGAGYGSSTGEPGNGGGGASDIRIGQDNLYARVIVAGGGGGGGEDTGDKGGYGGGTLGGVNSYGNSGTATQTSAGTNGSFGQGASTNYGDGGGGGGGWYGGGSIQYSSTTSDTQGGGGGSGYVYTVDTASNYPSGCLLDTKYYLTDAETIAGDQTFLSPDGTDETGHTGDGHIRITSQINDWDCKFIPAGTFMCTGELNTVTDFNTHEHNGPGRDGYVAGEDCLLLEYQVPPATFTYTETVQTYVIPYTDYYTLETYGPHVLGQGGYAKATYHFKQGTRLYIYVGSDTYNDQETDIRIVSKPGNQGVAGEEGTFETIVQNSNNSRLVRATSREGFANNFSSYTATNIETGTRGTAISGMATITCHNTPLSPTLDDIVEGNLTDEEVIKHLGPELFDMITNNASVFKTYSEFSIDDTKGVVSNNNTGVFFIDDNIVLHSKDGNTASKFYIRTDLEAQTLRRVRITLVNNTSSTEFKIAANNTPNTVSATMQANSINEQVLTFNVADAWNDEDISILYFLPQTKGGGVIKISKIELIGHATFVKDSSGYTNSNLLTLSNFTADDTKGFTNISNTSISYSGNKMIVTSKGSNPQTQWTTLNSMNTSAIKAIKLVFTNKSASTTQGRLYYKTSSASWAADNAFMWYIGGSSAGTQTVWIDTASHTAYNETMNMITTEGSGWSGTINNMRFDWSELTSGNIEVSSITFYGNGTTTGTGGYNSVLNCGLDESSNFYSESFSHTGAKQTATLPAGRYKLEVWGAQGGQAGDSTPSSYKGGLGGYSVGEITLSNSTNVYVYVGGQGYSDKEEPSDNGGFNGGADCLRYGGGGGGASDIRIGQDSLYARVIVAGGGGGGYSGSNKGNGGYGGGVSAGLSSTNTSNVNQTTGYRFGNGEVAASSGDTGGAGGGGWFGGYAGDNDYGTGGGGSGFVYTSSTASYTNSSYTGGTWLLNSNYYLTSAETKAGNTSFASPTGTSETGHSGDGYAKITGLSHTHTDSCYNKQSSPVTITSSTTSKVYYTATYNNPLLKENVRQTILDNYLLIPDYVDGDYNPLWLCRFDRLNTHLCVTKDGEQICKITEILKCNEPHHKKVKVYDENGQEIGETTEHYPGTNDICWDACGNDENHKLTKTQTELSDGSNVRLAEFLQLDEGFTVYFPNRGDFYGNGALGLSAPQVTRGYGYKNNMDTTNWTREKRVRFPFDVIYEGELYNPKHWIELDVTQEVFNFYLPVSNPEMSNVTVEFEVEAINCGTTDGVEVVAGINYGGELDEDVFNSVRDTYSDALELFIGSYMDNWIRDIKAVDGYKMPFTEPRRTKNSSDVKEPGLLDFEDFGYLLFYLNKMDEENKLEKAIDNVNEQIQKDFEGTNNDSNVINPHTVKGNSGSINNRMKSRSVNDNKTRISNIQRRSSLQSLHGAYKFFYMDVIGRIGNFAITDTEDYKFSNFFKWPTMETGDITDSRNWLVEGLVMSVDEGIQNYYIGDTYDIRGYEAKGNTLAGNDYGNLWLDTYGTQSWMRGMFLGEDGEDKDNYPIVAEDDNEIVRDRYDTTLEGESDQRDLTKPNLYSQILAGDVNNIDVLKEEEMQFGYDIFTSIVTFGNYQNGRVQVVPKYYALKLTGDEVPNVTFQAQRNEYIPLDVYISRGGSYVAVNIFGNAGNGQKNIGGYELDDYAFNLDWTVESHRRNYSLEEQARTKRICDSMKQYIYDIEDIDAIAGEGQFDSTKFQLLRIEEAERPQGMNNYLGTSQYMLMTGQHRTFIGSSNTYGNNIWVGPKKTTQFGVKENGKYTASKLVEPADGSARLSEDAFERAVQRWHGKLGVPSSSVFVPHDEPVNAETIKYVMNDNYAIICTAEIIVMGTTWNLAYSQPWFNTLTIDDSDYNTYQPGAGNGHYPGHRKEDGTPCPNCPPPIIAVYSSEASSVDDIEIVASH